MPSIGRTGRWPFYSWEGPGSFLEATRSLQRREDEAVRLQLERPILQSNAFSLRRGTTSRTNNSELTATAVLANAEAVRSRINGRRADFLIVDEMRSLHDDYLETLRYSRMCISRNWFNRDFGVVAVHPAVDSIYSPSINQLIEAQPIETPKEKEMNELMIALEAMMRRIVKEELALQPPVTAPTEPVPFHEQFKNYVDNCKHEFAALVSIGTLDMPWFDEAIKSEVAEAYAAIAPPQGYVFADARQFQDEVREVVRNADNIEAWLSDEISSRVKRMNFSVSVS